tara:strand:- start:1738 stop:2340 length:603 start_codon:yes stop_codon:yes gene_type:complete
MYFLYVSKPEDKEYDFDTILNYCSLSLEEIDWEIDEIYADGWTNIPNGIDDLIRDAKAVKPKSKLKGIALYSLEELSFQNLEELEGVARVYCVLTPWINPTKSPRVAHAAVKRSKDYYKSLTSLKIRHGVKASSKRSGAAPFGYRHDEAGSLVPNEDYQTLLNIVKLGEAGVSVSEIAKRANMSPAKVYGILKTAKGRDA